MTSTLARSRDGNACEKQGPHSGPLCKFYGPPPPHEIGHVPPIFKFFGPPPPQDWTCTPHLQFFFGGAPPPSQDWTPASIHVELQRRELTANPSDRFWNLEFQRSALLYMYIPTCRWEKLGIYIAFCYATH